MQLAHKVAATLKRAFKLGASMHYEATCKSPLPDGKLGTPSDIYGKRP
jgi:hypothetical protein